MSAKPKKKNSVSDGTKVICENRKARHDYTVLETVECGIMLCGSEVKSLRCGRCSLNEAYAKVKEGEVWLLGCDIQEYVEANRLNHKPKRPRKLLLHQREIRKMGTKAAAKGLTLVPLRMYFSKSGYAKVLLGVCQGKQKQDKRQALREADTQKRLRRFKQTF